MEDAVLELIVATALAGPDPHLTLSPPLEDGALVADVLGTWRDRGYARVLHVEAAGVTVYDTSDAGCVTTEVSPQELAAYSAGYARDGDVLTLADSPWSTRYVLDRIDAVPAVCDTPLSGTPRDVIAYFTAMMRDSYAFFDLHGVDWAQRTDTLLGVVTDDLSDPALFDLLVTGLEGLNDGHLELAAEIDGEGRRHVGQRTRTLGPRLREAYAKTKQRKSLGAFQTRWFFDQKKRIRKLLGTSKTDGAGGNLLYGRIGDVGYVAVYGMGGFADADDATMADELAAVHAAIGGAVDALGDTRALIFDLTLNQGGYDDVSLAIASHFATERTLAYTKQPFGQGTPPQAFHVRPAEGPRYTKPVVLVTSDVTVSAAEIFTMAMRSLPHVTHAGTTTMGALSDILEKPLPNRWSLSVSHEVYLDHEGVLWEGRGIPPQVTLPVWEEGPVGTSHATVLGRLARALSRQGPETWKANASR